MLYQQQLTTVDRLIVARNIVQAKLKNSRVILQRQQRRRPSDVTALAIKSLGYLLEKAGEAETWERLMGLEGSAASQYFSAFGESLTNPDFVFAGRSRRPPGNPTNALLSFGYQVLWNHLLSLIELQGLDPYFGCLHQGTEKHAALASDLIEEFRAPIVDSLVLWLINSKVVDADADFVYHDGGCYLNDAGRPKYLAAFLQRMEETVKMPDGKERPRWDLVNFQIKAFKQFTYTPVSGYTPHTIR